MRHLVLLVYCLSFIFSVVRDRMGRMLSFMGRLMTDNALSTIRGVGIDEQTALLLDPRTGTAIAVGKSYAFICSSIEKPKTCLPELSLTMTGFVIF